MRLNMLFCAVALFSTCVVLPHAFSDETSATNNSPTELRLFNPVIFGKRTTEPTVLLKPPQPEKLDPETVMVDIENGRYFAATVRYPLDISFEAARESLNNLYGKWEQESFADDPEMGIWRNEDDKFSIQLSDDGFNIVVIYIKFSMVTENVVERAFANYAKLTEEEETARSTIGQMRRALENDDFKAFYTTHCHTHLREQISEEEFVADMQCDVGKQLLNLFGAIDEAIRLNKGQDVMISRFNERDAEEFEFVLVEAQRQQQDRPPWHIELRKENGDWKLKDFD